MFRITVISATAPLAVRVHCVEPAHHPSPGAHHPSPGAASWQLVPPRGPPDVQAMTSPGGGGGGALRRPHLPAAAASMRPLRLCVFFTARRPPLGAPSVVACCCVAACCCPPTLHRCRRRRDLPPAPPLLRPGLVVCERLPGLGVAAPRARVEVRLGGAALLLGLPCRGLPGLAPHLQRDAQHRAFSANAPQLSQRAASSPRHCTAPAAPRGGPSPATKLPVCLRSAARRSSPLAPCARTDTSDRRRRCEKDECSFAPKESVGRVSTHGRHAAAGSRQAGRQAQQRACGESGCGGGGGGVQGSRARKTTHVSLSTRRRRRVGPRRPHDLAHGLLAASVPLVLCLQLFRVLLVRTAHVVAAAVAERILGDPLLVHAAHAAQVHDDLRVLAVHRREERARAVVVAVPQVHVRLPRAFPFLNVVTRAGVTQVNLSHNGRTKCGNARRTASVESQRTVSRCPSLHATKKAVQPP
jgi:hypothetical protein